jgi:hypothetical protein
LLSGRNDVRYIEASGEIFEPVAHLNQDGGFQPLSDGGDNADDAQSWINLISVNTFSIAPHAKSS